MFTRSIVQQGKEQKTKKSCTKRVNEKFPMILNMYNLQCIAWYNEFDIKSGLYYVNIQSDARKVEDSMMSTKHEQESNVEVMVF